MKNQISYDTIKKNKTLNKFLEMSEIIKISEHVQKPIVLDTEKEEKNDTD